MRRAPWQAQRAAQHPQAHPTSAALYSIWRDADLDGNGFLCEAEFKALNAALKVHWAFDGLWQEIQEMFDETTAADGWRIRGDGSREIGFGAFVQIYNKRMGSERRKYRVQVRAMFEKLDADRTGTLKISEINKLVQGTKKLLKLLPPQYEPTHLSICAGLNQLSYQLCDARFNLENDWHEMTLGEKREVSFADFDTWWKNRMGLVVSTTTTRHCHSFSAHVLESGGRRVRHP
eukprot:COSAG04_NODE_298_length_17490_cov_10.214249_11_plen_233_part_00